MNLKSLHWVLVFLCFVLGTFLRTWDFIENPGGMNQDELGSVYEAFALWTEGTDRWGLSWPSYFPAWGSGQNALLTYLSIPLVAVFGPSVFVVRGIVLASALATLPLIYFFARLAFCRTTALVALFFTAVCPWHVMMSRWGLESNLLPFFWMATMVSLQLGFRPQGANVFRVLAPVLAAVSLYAYSVAAFSMTAFVGFAVLFFWREFAKCWRMWMVGLAAGFVLGLPLLHFLLKNHVFKANLAVDAFVPWTAPLLPITRLAQLSGGTVDVVKANFFDFVGASFADGLVWNTLPGHRPLPEVLSFLALFGIVALFLDARRGSRAGFIALAALLGASVPFLRECESRQWVVPASHFGCSTRRGLPLNRPSQRCFECVGMVAKSDLGLRRNEPFRACRPFRIAELSFCERLFSNILRHNAECVSCGRARGHSVGKVFGRRKAGFHFLRRQHLHELYLCACD